MNLNMFNTRLEMVLSSIFDNGFVIKSTYSVLHEKTTNQVYGSELILERVVDKAILHVFAPVARKGVFAIAQKENTTTLKELSEVKDAEIRNGNIIL